MTSKFKVSRAALGALMSAYSVTTLSGLNGLTDADIAPYADSTISTTPRGW